MENIDVKEYNNIIDFMDIQVWILVDIDKYGIVNKHHARFLGRTKKELAYKKFDEVLSLEESQRCASSTKLAWESKEVVITEEWIKDSNGDRRLLKVTKEPQLNSNNEVKHVLCKAIDITEDNNRKIAQKILNKQYASIVENHENMICRFLPDTTLTYVNKAYCNMFGKNKEDLVGMKFLNLIPKEEHEVILQKLGKYTRESCINSYEHTIIDKNGEIGWQRWTDEAYFDEDGNIVEFQSTGTDISELKFKEELLDRKIKESEETLNHILEHDKLKTEFFANISHELRTPLNLILGTLQLIEIKTQDDNSLNKEYKIIRQNCYRLMRLIDNLIDVTKIDAGYLELSLNNSDIIKVAEDITLSIVEFANNKGITVIFDTNEEEHKIAFDLDKLERILLNLLSNAIKFSKENGAISVNVEVNSDYTNIIVRDNGIGIPENKLNEVFHRFVQVDRSFKRHREGSGIGLALTHELVKMHEGSISVESVINEGSTFTVQLPNKVITEDMEKSTANYYENCVEKAHIEFSDVYS